MPQAGSPDSCILLPLQVLIGPRWLPPHGRPRAVLLYQHRIEVLPCHLQVGQQVGVKVRTSGRYQMLTPQSIKWSDQGMGRGFMGR